MNNHPSIFSHSKRGTLESLAIPKALPLSSALACRTAPSLRVPVTAGNRTLLRSLRAAESAAWEAGGVCGRVYFTNPEEPSENQPRA